MWKDKVAELGNCLNGLLMTDSSGREMLADDGYALWSDETRRIRRDHGCVFFIGNGASASMASHFAADLQKNGRIKTQTFFDCALISAIGNDIAFDAVFSEPLELCLGQEDMLVAISSSGESPNIIKGVETALQKTGTVITLSAMKENNRLRKMGKLNFYVPASTYGLAESSHAAILHHWIDLML